MRLNIHAIEICTDNPECMIAAIIRCANLGDNHIGALSTYVMHRWPSSRAEVIKEVQPYWSFIKTAIDRVGMKGRRKISADIFTRNNNTIFVDNYGKSLQLKRLKGLVLIT